MPDETWNPAARFAVLLRVTTDDGERVYADREIETLPDAEPRLADTGEIRRAAANDDGQDIPVSLVDAEGGLRRLADAGKFDGRAARLSLLFPDAGTGTGTEISIAAGTLAGNGEWRENDRLLRLALRPASRAFRDRPIGRVADRREFPGLRLEDEGKAIPLVFGRNVRVPAIRVDTGQRTQLVRFASPWDTVLYVADAAAFPQGDTEIVVGCERMTGRFEGNAFRAETRGGAILTATVAETQHRSTVLRLDGLPAAPACAYAGMAVWADVPGRGRVAGHVLHSEESAADANTLWLGHVLVGDDGRTVLLEAGQEVSIGTLATQHDAGAPVYEHRAEYVYLASGLPAGKVRGVYARQSASPRGFAATRGLAPVDSSLWRYVPDDILPGDTLPGDILPDGSRGATVRLLLPLPSAPGQLFDDDRIWVDLDGVPDPDDPEQTLENPARVLQHFLAEFADADIDRERFDEIAAAREGELFAFRFEGPKAAGNVIPDLAFQARLALVWDGNGRVRPVDLDPGSETGAPAEIALGPDAVLADRVVVKDDAPAVGSLIARYRDTTRDADRDAAVFLRAASATLAGMEDAPHRDIRFWACGNRAAAAKAASFWLAAWSRPPRIVSVETFLRAVDATPHSTVRLTHPEFGPDGREGRIVSVSADPGRPVSGRPLRVRLDVAVRASCGSGCEAAACELSCQAACETACENACEGACQAACELACTAACETLCMTTCVVSRRAPDCNTGCEVSCETGCETSCELGCETAVEPPPERSPLDLAVATGEGEETSEAPFPAGAVPPGPVWNRDDLPPENDGVVFTALLAPPWVDAPSMSVRGLVANVRFDRGGRLLRIDHPRRVVLARGRPCDS